MKHKACNAFDVMPVGGQAYLSMGLVVKSLGTPTDQGLAYTLTPDWDRTFVMTHEHLARLRDLLTNYLALVESGTDEIR